MSARAFGPHGWKIDRLADDLSGKTYVITGGNSGIGFEAARMLGERGATVTILCRSEAKANDALEKLRARAPSGKFGFIQMDLSDLASVRRAADEVRAKHETIDALVNNAGIMMLPKRVLTTDGFETQFGVNHLGHFALSGLLAETVEASAGRFVSVSSIAHQFAPGFRFDDIMFERGYSPSAAYGQSKLADLSFAIELNRRLEESGCKARAFACHPGWSATNLQTTGPGKFLAPVMKLGNAVFSQPAEKGALPTVLCAASDDAEPGGYYGPTDLGNMKGRIDRARASRVAKSEVAAKKLWTLSEELTGVRWSIF